MRRIFVYFTSLALILIFSLKMTNAQDTLLIPLKMKIGFEASGPAIYFIEKKNLNAEGYFSVDLNEKYAAVLNAGYMDYSYSQYNYEYQAKGIFIRAGTDINLMKPEKSRGKYWTGIGLRYGLSRFNTGVPSFSFSNYWGTASSSITKKTNWGHFIEVSPGVRAELFRNVSVGWNVSLRMLIYTGTDKNLKPISFPGYGNAGKRINTGINYFIVWNIPYKKIRVITKKEEPEEPEEPEEAVSGQQNSGIRQ